MGYYSNAIIEPYRDAFVALCERYRVAKLYVFGSAVNGGFDSEQSDIDFLAQFEGREATALYADRVLGFEDALRAVFNRPIDLITVEALKCPGFKATVERTRRLVYEAGNTR